MKRVYNNYCIDCKTRLHSFYAKRCRRCDSINKKGIMPKNFEYMKSLPMTEETRQRKSDSKKGSKNPMFGMNEEKHHNYKGQNVGYHGLHIWIKKYKGQPCMCEHCGITKDEKRLHWANIDGRYKRDLSNYISLCPKCHGKYDKELKNEMVNESILATC